LIQIKETNLQRERRFIFMKTSTKAYLGIAAACLVLGLLIVTGVIHRANLPVLHVVLPLGVVFTGVALVWRAMEKETGSYEQEQAAVLARVSDKKH
jgi:hypothetical protein